MYSGGGSTLLEVHQGFASLIDCLFSSCFLALSVKYHFCLNGGARVYPSSYWESITGRSEFTYTLTLTLGVPVNLTCMFLDCEQSWRTESLDSLDLEPAHGYMVQFLSLLNSRPLSAGLTQAFFFIKWLVDHFAAFAVTQTDTTAVFHCIRVNAIVTANILKTKTYTTKTQIYKTQPGKHYRNTRSAFCVLINVITLKRDILLCCNMPPLPLFSVSYPATLPCTLH